MNLQPKNERPAPPAPREKEMWEKPHDEPIWSPGMTLGRLEMLTIMKAMRFTMGNKTKTAQMLGIAIRTLDNKLDKYAGKPVAEEALKLDAPVEQVAAVIKAVTGRGRKKSG